MSPEEQKKSQNINNAQPNFQPKAPLAPVPQIDAGHGLGIASLITSFFIGIAGIILGIISLNKSKKAGCKNGLAVAGIIIGAIQTTAVIVALFISAFTTFLFFGSVNDANNIHNDSQATISADEIELSELAYDKYMETGLAVNYPSNWTVEYSPVEISEYRTVTSGFDISSPDGKVDLVFSLFKVTGFGTSCDASTDNIDIENTQIYDFGSIEDYPNLGFVSSINWKTDSNNKEYGSYYIGTYSKTGVVTHVGQAIDVNKTGTFTCEKYEGFDYYDVNTDNYGRVFFKVYMKISDDYIGPGAVSAATVPFSVPYKNYVDDFMKTDDYKIAKRIIQSLHIEE